MQFIVRDPPHFLYYRFKNERDSARLASCSAANISRAFDVELHVLLARLGC